MSGIMAQDVWKDLHQWRAGRPTNTITTNERNENKVDLNKMLIPQLPRSFRPHRIVPHLYVGSLNDINDTWALQQRLIPDELFLLISACGRGESPTLELRELIPSRHTNISTTTTTTITRRERERGEKVIKNEKDDNNRVRRLALCSWDKLKEYVMSVNNANRESSYLQIAEWLQHVLESRSFTLVEKGLELTETNNDTKNNRKFLYFKLSLPWEDEPSFPVIEHFSVVTALMRAVVEGLEKTVVCYCMAGKSRSITLVCAFLLRSCCSRLIAEEKVVNVVECNSNSPITNNNSNNNSKSVAAEMVKVVLDFVQEVRCCACPNVGFIQQLQLYAGELIYGERRMAL
ncbi:Dual specificity phosphatase [Trypanosoma melophagium]|uniref:Dual specificity phosphatase n=1 Tax=Trypanosoma melophagium TaxID=715481 RepID=UPI003519EC00|nr:Dual specificity phosphatase [Trypanosoma melophagium]